jgi:hypothetical protein
MDLLEAVLRLEQEGGHLRLDGERIRYSVPSDRPEALELIRGLRERRNELEVLLRERERQTEFEHAGRLIGGPHVKLFSYIGCKVRTPGGSGTLVQVFVDRATVILDCELCRCSFFLPDQIEPVSSPPFG